MDVDRVINLLSIVKNKGWDAAFAEDVLYGGKHCGNRLTESHRPYEGPLLSLRQTLEDSKLCMAMLNKVKERLGKKIRSLRKRVMPSVLEDGIKRLPDELLAKIFELEHFSVDRMDDYALRSVSHVCHRFREVALHTPRLWTRLAATNPDAQIKAFISRSGQLDLEVITPGAGPLKIESFLLTVGPHSNRWSHLELCDEAPFIMQKRGLTRFPRLRFLHYWDDELPAWDTPSVLWLRRTAAHVKPGVSFQAQLTTFEITFEDMEDVNIRALAQSLECMTSLQDLIVHAMRISRGDNDSSWKIKLNPHSVPIASLTVSVGEGVTSGIAQELCGVLSVFEASRLTISLRDVDKEPISYITSSKGKKLCLFGSVMVIHINQEVYIPNIIRTISENHDMVHTIHFDTPVAHHYCTYGPFNPKRWFPPTSIRNLQFQNCVTLDEESVGFMAKHPAFAAIQKLKILHCSHISEEYLLDLQDEVGEKLKWTI